MLITRESDYALRIMRVLADEKIHKTQDICDSESIPSQIVHKIIKKLEKSGLIKIVQGRNGGCLLCCKLEDISLYDVMSITGDAPLVNACTGTSYDCSWRSTHGQCSYHNHLTTLQTKLTAELQALALDDLLK